MFHFMQKKSYRSKNLILIFLYRSWADLYNFHVKNTFLKTAQVLYKKC